MPTATRHAAEWARNREPADPFGPAAREAAMTPTATGEERRNGYQHLAPLFVVYRCLTRNDPRRRELRNQLITGYRPVAQNIAHRYAHRGENPEDLEQVATLGSIMAVDRFEPDREVDFLSFAVPTITGEVLRYFRDRSALVRVPRQLRMLRGQIYDAAAELGQRHGRAARPSEIAAFLEVDIEVVLDGLTAQAAGHTSSLDEPATDDSERGGRTRFDAALRYIEPHFDLIEDRAALGPLLAELPDRERTILLLRFFRGLTQTEIGQQVGISQMHVSRLLSRTLTSLRRKLAADHKGIDPLRHREAAEEADRIERLCPQPVGFQKSARECDLRRSSSKLKTRGRPVRTHTPPG